METTAIITKQHDSPDINSQTLLNEINTQLTKSGYVLLRGFDVNAQRFSDLIHKMCAKVSFDPARENLTDKTQKVDSGNQEIGLHIENGNTPFPPDIVAFYSHKSASVGSQTTVCDGIKLWQDFPNDLKQIFNQKITVSRTLPENIWKSYAVNEHPLLNHIDEINNEHLPEILKMSPNHQGELNLDGSLNYTLTISPCVSDNFINQHAFANAILGPSFNYEEPVYQFEDGKYINDALKKRLKDIAKKHTHEVNWQDQDVLVIDNKRVMHGRRKIQDPENRKLYIGMGTKS